MRSTLRGNKMITYKDKTFCSSPACKNECGRKITTEQHQEANRLMILICWGYFCGEPIEIEEKTK